MRQNVEQHPKFFWRNFLRSTFVLCIDTAILFVICWLTVFFVQYHILGGRIDISLFSGDDWVKILDNIAWPLVAIVSLFLFRNPVLLLIYEIQGLIFRSYYKHGGRDDLDEDIIPRTSSSEPIGKGETSFKQRILSHLEKQYGKTFEREICIIDSSYYFDALAIIKGKAFGIVVTSLKENETFDGIIGRVGGLYKKFDDYLQERFVFVLCLIDKDWSGKDTDSLKAKARNQKFPIELRFFEATDCVVKELLCE